MARLSNWSDDYWLLIMQLYMRNPVGVKPVYSKPVVDLSMELHIRPAVLHEKMCAIDSLDTPRIGRIWERYADSPRRLGRAVRMLREMKGFNNADEFYSGVEVNETFELDFRPVAEDASITPVMLILILDLYFRLTPATMVAETPEIVELARLIRMRTDDIAEIMQLYQQCDPYLNRTAIVFNPLLLPCQRVWTRFGNGNPGELASLAGELSEYFKS